MSSSSDITLYTAHVPFSLALTYADLCYQPDAKCELSVIYSRVRLSSAELAGLQSMTPLALANHSLKMFVYSGLYRIGRAEGSRRQADVC